MAGAWLRMAAESITIAIRTMAAKASHSATASTKGQTEAPPNRATVVTTHSAVPTIVAQTSRASCEIALATTNAAREIGLVRTRTAVPDLRSAEMVAAPTTMTAIVTSWARLPMNCR